MTEKFCRVCRCEGTPDQPLFHPCKCRGSIKYIHQDCLQFWLEHSNKKVCDICHSKFNFKIIYNENVPNRLPIHLILKQIFLAFIKYQYIVVKYSLMAFAVVIEIPFTVALFDRIVNWQLGVSIPSNHIWKTLIFGNPISDDDIPLHDTTVSSFVLNNMFYGLMTTLFYTIVITSMIMIQNSFVGDEGFQKIINKKIGVEPKRFKLMEMLKRAQEAQNLQDARKHQRLLELQRNSYRMRAIQLSKDLTDSYNDDDLNYGDPITIQTCHTLINSDLKLIHDIEIMRLTNSRLGGVNPYDYTNDKLFLTSFNPELEFSNPNSIKELLLLDKKIRLNEIEKGLGDSFMQNCKKETITSIDDLFVGYPDFEFTLANAPSSAIQVDPLPAPRALHIDDDDDDDDLDLDVDADLDATINDNQPNWADEIEQVLQEVNNLPRQAPAVAQPNIAQPRQAPPPPPAIDEVPVGMWDGPKNITFVLQLTLLANLVSLIVLISFKLVPSYIGILFLSTINTFLIMPIKWGTAAIQSYDYYLPIVENILQSNTVVNIIDSYNDLIVPKLFVSFMHRNIIDPIHVAYANTINYAPTNNSFERIMVMFSGYTFFILIVIAAMKYMESCCNPTKAPLAGTSRLIYISLLQIISILKVLILIVTEWLCFPLFCGLQIEFALVPIFNSDLYNYKLEDHFISMFIPKALQIWLTGTFFMYYFASFVSMIRSKILRTGVLFFIRPSDDPNLQLVHDALMRPFLLRISRIALSAAVYSVYIIIEFIIVSWAIRLFSPIQALPFVNRFFLEKVCFCFMFTSTGFLDKLFFKFWNHVFILLSSKLRLSSFLLDKDIPEERGIIVYRSIWSRLTNTKPNYEHPVIESETNEYFKQFPNESSCFVPNGNYIRVPNDDHVSRKFVKTLFVSVTKTDQLLEPLPEIIDDEEKYNPYGDVDPMDVTTYTITYRPPNFKFRLTLLFAGLWFVSLIMTLGFYIINLIFGRFTLWILGIDKLLGINASYFSVDGYSMLLTIGIMYQILNSWERIKSSTGNIVNVLWIGLYENIRSLIVLLRNNFIVANTCRLTFATISSLFITSSTNPIISQISNNSITLFVIVFGFQLPLFYSLLSHDNKILKYYYMGVVADVLVRLMTINYIFLTSSPSLSTIETFEPIQLKSIQSSIINLLVNRLSANSDGMMSQLTISFITSPSSTTLLNYVHLGIWVSIIGYIGLYFGLDYWFKFVENTKEVYYSNMKVLSNVEDENDDDDYDNDDDNDNDNDNNDIE